MIEVVIGLISHSHFEDQLLITKRSERISHGGFWEFPGGKIEVGETYAEALKRELQEELGIKVISYSYLAELIHVDDNKPIKLFIYKINEYQGYPEIQEDQEDIRWVKLDELKHYHFPKANTEILKILYPPYHP